MLQPRLRWFVRYFQLDTTPRGLRLGGTLPVRDEAGSHRITLTVAGLMCTEPRRLPRCWLPTLNPHRATTRRSDHGEPHRMAGRVGDIFRIRWNKRAQRK